MFCLHLNISEHLTFKISSERSTCLKWELKTAHLSLLCVIWREMAFVLAQAICKKRSNGLRLLHLPLERSEEPPPISIFICSASRVSPISVKPESSALKLDGIWWKNPQSPNWLQREGVDRKNLYSPPESTINELSSQTVVIMRAALWRSCSRFGSVYLEFRPVFFIWKHFLGAHSLALCRDAERGSG